MCGLLAVANREHAKDEGSRSLCAQRAITDRKACQIHPFSAPISRGRRFRSTAAKGLTRSEWLIDSLSNVILRQWEQSRARILPEANPMVEHQPWFRNAHRMSTHQSHLDGSDNDLQRCQERLQYTFSDVELLRSR